MTPTSLKPRALYEDVAEQLRQRIFAGELKPGTWIDELKLCDVFGISRTPMREALKVLAAEGLVTMKVRRGAYVTEVGPQDLRDIYHLLALLEADAAAMACRRATAVQIDALRSVHDQLERSTAKREQFFALNEQFHVLLMSIAANKWRDQLVAELRQVLKLARHHSLLKAGRIQESLAEHRVLMDALARGDAAQAEQAMRLHIENGLNAAL
jgi:DNA-binding GntR family transcriptional regulator